MDDAFGQLALEITSKVFDFVFQRAGNFAEVIGQTPFNGDVKVGDAFEAEPIVNSLLIAFADDVEFAERAADGFQLRWPQARNWRHAPLDIAEKRQALAVILTVNAPHTVLLWVRAGE